MHTILRVTMTDVSAANAAIDDGRLEKIFQMITKKIHPESSFFYSDQGYRTALYIFDMKDASQIPQIVEPFFTGLNAKVELFPAMNADELNRGLTAWNKEAPNFISLS